MMLMMMMIYVGADVNAADNDGDTCLHMILKLIARGDAGKHQLDDLFNCNHIPLVNTLRYVMTCQLFIIK